MKNLKLISKILSVALVFALVFTLSISVFADEILEDGEVPAILYSDAAAPADASVAAPAPADMSAYDEYTTETESGDSTISTKAIAAGAVVGVVAAIGVIGMALSICKSTEGMARQPEAASQINSSMMLGLVFIETAIIYALIVAILIIFVL